MNKTELRFLRSLRDASAEGLPWSRVPVSCRTLLSRLCTCGAIQVVPGVQGKRLRISSAEAFLRVVQSACPHGLDALESTLSSREDSVRWFGDAKTVSSGSVQGVFVRAAKAGVILRRTGGDGLIDVSSLTQIAGGAAIILSNGVGWGFSGTVATVENEEAFWQHQLVLPDVDLAVYTRGKMSSRLLGWLASEPMADCQLLHWGDYDPVGILEYLRLRDACPGRVHLHIPDNLEALINRYGKRTLIEARRQTQTLSMLRRRGDDPTVQGMLQVFDRCGKGLEQELLLALARGMQDGP